MESFKKYQMDMVFLNKIINRLLAISFKIDKKKLKFIGMKIINFKKLKQKRIHKTKYNSIINFADRRVNC